MKVVNTSSRLQGARREDGDRELKGPFPKLLLVVFVLVDRMPTFFVFGLARRTITRKCGVRGVCVTATHMSLSKHARACGALRRAI